MNHRAPDGQDAPPAPGRRVTIGNRRGLHARAAARFVKLAGNFDAKVTVGNGDTTVSALSLLGLMMLGASPGQELELAASGPQADAALAALSDLIARKFDED